MEEYIKSVKLAIWMVKYLKGEMNGEEVSRFQQWLDEDPAHVIWLEELKNGKNISRKIKEYDRYDTEKSWKKVQGGIRDSRKLWYKWSAVAAVMLLFLGSVYWFLRADVSEPELVGVIMAGTHKARLVLDNGEAVNLDTLVKISLKEVSIAKDNQAGLIYAKRIATEKTGKAPVYHQLWVPRGGEYDVTLEDGTRVWLNADTKLKYPVFFEGKERKVFLEGEAYFAVAKDAARPFRIVVDGQTVEVLGTEFNVSAYREEEQVYTTLVEGKVKITTLNREELVLSPGEQAILQLQNGQLARKKVCVEEFVSWKSGQFVFEDQNLGQIMRKLARWYDFQVFYQNESLKEVVFQGSIVRYEDFGKVLKLLECTGEMRFKVRGKTVVVYK